MTTKRSVKVFSQFREKALSEDEDDLDGPEAARPSGQRTAATSNAYDAEALSQVSPDQFSTPLVLACSLAIVLAYSDRSNLATAVIPMSEQLGWSESYSGILLGSFFVGYLLTQLAGGAIADSRGGRMVLLTGLAVWSLCTLSTPFAALSGHSAVLLSVRFGLGLGEGVAFPAVHSLIANYVPPNRQSTAVSIVTSASYLGVGLAFAISPILISSSGWESCFYFFGGASLLWIPLWLTLPFPTASGLGMEAVAATEDADPNGSPAVRSAGDIARYLAAPEVWAIILAQYCGSFGLYGLLNWLPRYYYEGFGVELSALGNYTTLPYILQGALGVGAGVVADQLIKRRVRVLHVRKALQTVGMISPAVCLVWASHLSSAEAGSLLVAVGLGLNALTVAGVSASQLDIAPENAGTIFAAGNSAATIAGIVSVPLVGFLLEKTHSWPLVFGVTAGHYVVGAIAFLLLAGDQPLHGR